MNDADALDALAQVAWNGESLADEIQQAAEWNAEIQKRNWRTNKHYWKMRAARSFGRWKYQNWEDDEDEINPELSR